MKNIIFKSIAPISTVILPLLTYAQENGKLDNPLKAKTIQDVIYLLVDIALYFGTAFAILALIYVGFKFVTAGGNEDKIKETKQWFYYIIIGYGILISAELIVYIVKNTLISSGITNSF